jgi:thiamine biosynthesis lipoprotein
VDQPRGTARRLTTLPISLDGIAKGYIVSRAAARGSETRGVLAVMLNIGGDIQHVGEHARSASIVAGIANPFDAAENAPPIAAVRLHGNALASSGGYRRGFHANGQWHSHIVDPRTGIPVRRVVGASVIAPDCTTADALSTALSVLTPAQGIMLADSLPGVGCLLIEADGVICTSSFWKARAVDRRTPTGGPVGQPFSAVEDRS